MVTSLAGDLTRAEWDKPEHIRSISFAVNGLTDDVWRPRIGGTLGIISPFVTDEALVTLSRGIAPAKACLLSRAEGLAFLQPETLARFDQVAVLDEMAETEDGDEGEEDGPITARGLHAKAFITERYSSTKITIGSGNATAPALVSGNNVEVFAILSG